MRRLLLAVDVIGPPWLLPGLVNRDDNVGSHLVRPVGQSWGTASGPRDKPHPV